MRLLRSLVILIFLATAGTVTLGIWSALLNSDRKELLLVPSSAAADAGKTAPPAPAALKAAPADTCSGGDRLAAAREDTTAAGSCPGVGGCGEAGRTFGIRSPRPHTKAGGAH